MALTNSTKTKRQVIQNTEDIRKTAGVDDRIFRRIGGNRATQQSRLGDSRRAVTTQGAPASDRITANLYNVGTGIADAGEITVYCNISNGSLLSEAAPLLFTDTDITVYQSVWTDGATTEIRWFCSTNFDTDKSCVCTDP